LVCSLELELQMACVNKTADGRVFFVILMMCKAGNVLTCRGAKQNLMDHRCYRQFKVSGNLLLDGSQLNI